MVMTSDPGCDDLAFGLVGVELDFGELRGAPHAGVFHQDSMGFSKLRSKVKRNLRIPRLP